MRQAIQHRGVIHNIEHLSGGEVCIKVRIEKVSACSGCHAKSLCSEHGSERIIEVRRSDAEGFALGDRVVVALERNTMGAQSVAWAYLLPLAVLLITLFALHALGAEDGLAALGSIVAVAIYYLILYTLRHYFDRKIKFTIIKE